MRNAIIVIVIFFAGCFLTDLFRDSPNKNVDGVENTVEKNSPLQEQVNKESNVCEVCGKSFFGNGFSEITQGIWEETKDPYQSFICSKTCGLKHTSKWNSNIEDSQNNHAYDVSNSEYSTGRDGRIYENQTCDLCNGTGIEVATAVNPDTGITEKRICPACNGKGRKSY